MKTLKNRFLNGGSWYSDKSRCEVISYRGYGAVTYYHSNIGFRLIKTLK